jgi:hypothetical protein
MKNVKAQIIGETSAGMVAVMIFEDDKLVWSHDYFSNGSTESQYHANMQCAREDAEACEDWREFDGCDRDEEDNVVNYNRYDTNWIVAEYTTHPNAEWTAGNTLRHDGMSEDFLRHHPDIAEAVGYAIED